MCQHAWNMENAINMVWELFVEGGSCKKEKEGKKMGVALVRGILYWAWLTLYGKNISSARQTLVDDTHLRS